MKITLVISVYKDVPALRAVLKSVLRQKEKEVEVIVSQDCEDPCFDDLLAEFSTKLNLVHLQQPDNGFLKNKLLNRVIQCAKSDKLAFIDGDCVLHPRFLDQYVKHIIPNRMCIGRRVDLDGKTSTMLKSGKKVVPSFLNMVLNKTTRVEEALFLPNKKQKAGARINCLGCNMGWHKDDLLRLNGFDEDYVNPGFGEDTDIEYRGKLAGMTAFSMRFKAIQFHLFHERPGREPEVSISKALFESRKGRADFRCQNGIEKLPA